VHSAKKIAKGPVYELTEGEKVSLAFRRSIFAVKDIEPGEPFTKENVRIIRPSDGLAPKYFKELLGQTSKREILRGEPILAEDLKG